MRWIFQGAPCLACVLSLFYLGAKLCSRAPGIPEVSTCFTGEFPWDCHTDSASLRMKQTVNKAAPQTKWECVESAAPGRGFAPKAVVVLKCTLKVRSNARSYQTTKYPVVEPQSTLIF